ncbi:transmembrane sensor/regulator PpyR [Pseudomonas frederiksbergensis]|uniref:Transmembrane sensor/regulator PpyR n=1 Tax=Pseudomonas frederiksbergensis TaxID=104087 RepID=A0A423KD83_9PSED|nr:transmembrane sensor/regulator PpyR [Pseudomonas frederiksbergensis]RON50320.1 transmembrane sensor/regulator PpyR [Pseudomonas frederiksbergensis]
MFDFFSNPQNVLRLSSKVLGLGLTLLLVGIYGAYFYGGHLPIVALVSMHAMTIIGPTLLKIGYVMRLLAQHRLSVRPVAAMA